MIVILIGYMASGKSSLGTLLAKKIDFDFIDLDDYIEKKEGLLVKNIFADKGEIYFRRVESVYLSEIITQKDNIILSLGGGTPCYGKNMEVILKSKNVKSIYLKASIASLIDRLKNKKDKRPLISHLESEEELSEFIGKHLFERSVFYDQAQYKIVTDNKNKNEIVEEIYSTLI